MITLDDIKDMACLTREEIAALSEHEHLDSYDATMLGEYLMNVHHGAQTVHNMICEDIRAALHADDVAHARQLFAVLRGFLAQHPEATRGVG